jgi:transposase
MSQPAGERALRAELAELRAVNAELRRSNELLAEQVTVQQQLIGTQRTQIATLSEQVRGLERLRELLEESNRGLARRLTELERRLGQNPRNSDRPPSSEGHAKPPPRSLHRPGQHPSGGQPGHPGATLRQVTVSDERVLHRPQRCEGCGAPLAGTPEVGIEARQVFDLPQLRLRVIEHALIRCRCACGRSTTAPAPPGVAAPTQYGPGVRGLATYLVCAQHLPLARTAELLTELLAAPVSEGSLVGWCATAAAGLAGFDAALAARLATAPVLGADETGIRVEGKTRWVHATRTDTLTRYTVLAKRGIEAMKDAGVLSALPADTVLVHDFWAPYWGFQVQHAVCAAHLLRELTAAAEADGQADWADGIADLLCRLNDAAIAARAAGAPALDQALLAEARARYGQLIANGWAANPDHWAGQRGWRPKHVNLLDRLDGHRDEVLRFAADLRVPFTNNGSERDIRPLKIKMNVAGCLRTLAGAQTLCRLRSYLSTARKHGQSAFAALRQLHDSGPWLPAVLQPA